MVRVVAAEDFWGSIAAQIGGAHAHVVSIIANPETDPHAYEPTAADARTLADAEVAVLNGAGYDPWMQRAAGRRRRAPRPSSTSGTWWAWPPGGNPHLWYDPAFVDRYIGAVTADLPAGRPGGRRLLRRPPVGVRAGRTGRRTTPPSARIRATFAGTPVGASESIVVYLCRALGLDLVTPPSFLRAISEGTDVSAADTATIDRQIATRSIAVYLENTQNLTPDVQAQVRAARARRASPSSAVTETLQPAGDTFQAWQTAQLHALDTALEHTRG